MIPKKSLYWINKSSVCGERKEYKYVLETRNKSYVHKFDNVKVYLCISQGINPID